MILYVLTWRGKLFCSCFAALLGHLKFIHKILSNTVHSLSQKKKIYIYKRPSKSFESSCFLHDKKVIKGCLKIFVTFGRI